MGECEFTPVTQLRSRPADLVFSPPPAVQLTHQERNQVVKAARSALDADSSLSQVPLIAGTGASSTKETIELTKEAAEAGADFAMVISPGASLLFLVMDVAQ